jgi:hypothetical protein
MLYRHGGASNAKSTFMRVSCVDPFGRLDPMVPPAVCLLTACAVSGYQGAYSLVEQFYR